MLSKSNHLMPKGFCLFSLESKNFIRMSWYWAKWADFPNYMINILIFSIKSFLFQESFFFRVLHYSVVFGFSSGTPIIHMLDLLCLLFISNSFSSSFYLFLHFFFFRFSVLFKTYFFIEYNWHNVILGI